MTELTAMRTRATTDNVELAYWRHVSPSANGKTLLLLHGGASNHTRWSEFAALTTLNRQWNIIAPDMRGNGASMTRDHINTKTWCSDLNDILIAEHAKSVVIVGHSLGAQIALHFTARFPDTVKGLVLIDTIFKNSLKGRSLMVSRHPKLIGGLVNIIRYLNRLGFRRRKFITPDLRSMDIQTRKALQGAESFDEIAKRYSALWPILRHIPVANYLRQALATVSPLPPLKDIDSPVLSILSAGSTVGELKLNEQEISQFKHSEVVTLNANHWPLTETPEQVREAVEEWVNRTC